jgi:hypothetical protein
MLVMILLDDMMLMALRQESRFCRIQTLSSSMMVLLDDLDESHFEIFLVESNCTLEVVILPAEIQYRNGHFLFLRKII